MNNGVDNVVALAYPFSNDIMWVPVDKLQFSFLLTKHVRTAVGFDEFDVGGTVRKSSSVSNCSEILLRFKSNK